MNLQRVLHTRFSDLADRARQEVWKSVERRRAVPPATAGPLPHARGNARLRSAEALFRHFLERGTAHFFGGFRMTRLPVVLSRRFPQERSRIVALADAACEGRLDLLGYRGLYVGHPVDWHRDPVSGRSAPLLHWSRVDALAADKLGDSKLTWELNRHQWFLYLGQAYCFTKEERYAETWAAYVRSWLEDNPPEFGINWASSLELAYRVIAWCWSLYLFRGARALDAELFADIVSSIELQTEHIERYLSRHYSPNTHLTGEALGLLYAGIVFPELSRAACWRRLGRRILLRESRHQVLADGVYFEQSSFYQRYTVETYLHWLILAKCNGLSVPASVSECVQHMLDFLMGLRRPDGTIPQIGDADGGSLLPLLRRPPEDFGGTFAVAATWFRRTDYAWAAGGSAPEVLWLFGDEGRTTFRRLTPAKPHRTSQLFPHGGYAVMRDSWERQAHQLIFDVGPLGCPVSGGHGHADLLSIQCSVFGEPQLLDPGTFCYTVDRTWRDYFRGSSAHSTLTVDHRSQALPTGPFSWRRRPRARLNRWQSNAEFDLADAEHDAYFSAADPVIHRRRVLFVKPRYWLVVDDISGRERHTIELHFQFAPIAVKLDADGWTQSRDRFGNGLWLRAFCAEPLTADLQRGSLDPLQGWVSPDYGRLQAAPMLRYCCNARLPLRIATLVLPSREMFRLPPKIMPLFSNDELRLLFNESGEVLRINAQDIIVEPRQPSDAVPASSIQSN